MPLWFLFVVLLTGLFVLLQLIPVPRHPVVKAASFWTSMIVNEQPHWIAAALVAATAVTLARGDIVGPVGWATVGLAAVVIAGLIRLLLRAFPSRPVLREAIASLDRQAPDRIAARRRFGVTLLAPLAFGRAKVERIADIPYGPHGRRNLLDVYRPRNGEVRGPTLIYLHGGGFTTGAKKREGQLALYRLAGRGWFCISANYRLSPEVQFPDYVVDLKRVISWVRREGSELGADPERIFLAGGSAGGHVAATAALTPGEPLLQPGFEADDTSVSGMIGLYGYYGGLRYGSLRPRGPLSSKPGDLVKPGSPPFLLVHGSRDTVVSIHNARSFEGKLRAAGGLVALAELPGAQHTFDLLRSVRAENTIDAIEDFAAIIGRERSDARP